MHVNLYKTNFLVDLSCWMMYEVIILSESKKTHSTLSSIPPFIVAISALVEYRLSLFSRPALFLQQKKHLMLEVVGSSQKRSNFKNFF